MARTHCQSIMATNSLLIHRLGGRQSLVCQVLAIPTIITHGRRPFIIIAFTSEPWIGAIFWIPMWLIASSRCPVFPSYRLFRLPFHWTLTITLKDMAPTFGASICLIIQPCRKIPEGWNYLNYGIRALLTSSDGKTLFAGTANPMNLEAKGGGS